MQNLNTVTKFSFMEQERPVLTANVTGSAEYPDAHGVVYVYVLPNGVYVQGDIEGLPKSSDFAFHVHKGLLCDDPGDKLLIFPDVMSDADGKASAQIYLDREDVTSIAGRPIMLHLKKPDGTEVQMACGLLSRVL